MNEPSERRRLAGVWYNLTVEERWNGPILLALFAVLIGGGVFLIWSSEQQPAAGSAHAAS